MATLTVGAAAASGAAVRAGVVAPGDADAGRAPSASVTAAKTATAGRAVTVLRLMEVPRVGGPFLGWP
ncbi:hypothetical protein Aph02nite_24330 [Actinoplanes philippinensis]|nr:hypothetical protein Aph02nite_24330 [Actinoplanes philippinensis]